jgi:hypothetical protein
MSSTSGVPREFEALGLGVDAVDETGVPWELEVAYGDAENTDDGVRATWTRPFIDGWVLRCSWTLVDGTVQLEGFHVVRATPDARAPTAKVAGNLRLGSAYYQVRRLFRKPWLGFFVPEGWLHAIERDGLGVPKPGRPGGEALLGVEWAAKYEDACKRDPRRPIALLVRENPGYSAAAIRARLTSARKLGLLTAADSGKAGGELTEEAKRLLKEGR